MHHLPRPSRKARGRLRPYGGFRALPLALALAVALPSVSQAQIYRWTDEKGTVHFSDSLQGVPRERRPGIEALDDRLPRPPPPSRIPLTQATQGYLVDAQINGKDSVRLVLDTGATSTVLSRGAAQRLGLDIRTKPPVMLQTANGPVEAAWAEVEEIEVGGRRAGPLRVVIHDAVPGADGLLGMNFLGAFRVEIQADGPSLILSPP